MITFFYAIGMLFITATYAGDRRYRSSPLRAGTYELFLFGSRVANGGSPRSDIDVGIEAETPLPSSLMRRIREDLEELRTLYTVDFVNFKTVSPEFRRFAERHIELFATASDVKMRSIIGAVCKGRGKASGGSYS